MTEETFLILAASLDSIEAGHVWVQSDRTLPQRAVCKIINLQNNKSVHCEVLKIDKNYIRSRRGRKASLVPNGKSVIAMNQWYRSKLEIDAANVNCKLSIQEQDNCIAKLSACFLHPQLVVRLATSLACISLFLGVAGVAISVVGMLY